MNMRTASLMGKIMGHDYYKAPAGEAFAAATLGGAKSLGRDDLGKLAKGALADIIIIDFSGKNSPALWTCPRSDQERCRLRRRRRRRYRDRQWQDLHGRRRDPGSRSRQIRDEAQQSGNHVWSTVQDWDPRGRTADEASPWSFPLPLISRAAHRLTMKGTREAGAIDWWSGLSCGHQRRSMPRSIRPCSAGLPETTDALEKLPQVVRGARPLPDCW